MVRRAAAKALVALIPLADGAALKEALFPAFQILVGDEHDSVRTLAVEAAAPLVRALPPSAVAAGEMTPYIRAVSRDRSWRVRQAAAKHLASLADALSVAGEAATASSSLLILEHLSELLQDPEPEVRAAAAKSAKRIAEVAGAEQFASSGCLNRVAKACAESEPPTVRVAATETLLRLAAAGSLATETSGVQIVGVIEKALADPAAEVRLAALDSLASVAATLPPSALEETVVKALLTLAEDPLWRVREKVLAQLPLLAEILVRAGSAEGGRRGCRGMDERRGWNGSSVFFFRRAGLTSSSACLPTSHSACLPFLPPIPPLLPLSLSPSCAQGEHTITEKLLPRFLDALTDQVYAVRDAATRSVAPLARVLRVEWASAQLLPHLRSRFDVEESS
jgi:hypothetical protein